MANACGSTAVMAAVAAARMKHSTKPRQDEPPSMQLPPSVHKAVKAMPTSCGQ